jgi:hypothetical protein
MLDKPVSDLDAEEPRKIIKAVNEATWTCAEDIARKIALPDDVSMVGIEREGQNWPPIYLSQRVFPTTPGSEGRWRSRIAAESSQSLLPAPIQAGKSILVESKSESFSCRIPLGRRTDRTLSTRITDGISFDGDKKVRPHICVTTQGQSKLKQHDLERRLQPAADMLGQRIERGIVQMMEDNPDFETLDGEGGDKDETLRERLIAKVDKLDGTVRAAAKAAVREL